MAGKVTKQVGEDVITSLQRYNSDYGTDYDMGSNWTSVGTMFETYITKYLFPKLNESTLIVKGLGNRFDFTAREKEFIGQLDEEYVFKDSVPLNMNLSKDAELMLKRNYPEIISRLYQGMFVKKMKFTLNDNDQRQNFATLGDAVKYALGIYRKKISDINYNEELELKAMLVDYSLNTTTDKRQVSSMDDMVNQIVNGILDLQDSSALHNEYAIASGGDIGRYTTATDLTDICILTNNRVKTFMLLESNANKFHIDGIDLTKRIISFSDLGGVFKLTEDVQILSKETVTYMRGFGDYQVEINDVIIAGMVIPYPVDHLTEFKDKVEEIKPLSDTYAYVFDIKKMRYHRNTKNMVKQPFYNGEFDEYQHWIHYPQSKQMSPFWNNIVFTEHSNEDDE